MKFLLLILAILLLPFTVQADDFGIEFLHWHESAPGQRLMDEYVPRATWRHTSSLPHGITYTRKNYLGVGLYDGHDTPTGQHVTDPTAYIGSQNEMAYRIGPVKAAIGADGWYRTKEVWLTTYAKLGADVQVGRFTLDAGAKRELKTWQDGLLTWRSDYNGSADPIFKPVSKTTPYVSVTYALRPGVALRAYYDAYRFGATPHAPGAWYQPDSRGDIVGLSVVRRF